MENISEVCVSIGSRPFGLDAVALKCGRDWSVIVGGGERYHIGASAVAFVQPSLKDPKKMTGTVSVITVPGHKEDVLARGAALKLAKALQTTVSVAVGIHIENATQEDIQKLVSLFDQLVVNLAVVMAEDDR